MAKFQKYRLIGLGVMDGKLACESIVFGPWMAIFAHSFIGSGMDGQVPYSAFMGFTINHFAYEIIGFGAIMPANL